MTGISFRRVAEDEARIYRDGETVGDLVRHTDIVTGGTVYIAHLDEDPRGFCRIHDRARIREMVEERVRTHPLWR